MWILHPTVIVSPLWITHLRRIDIYIKRVEKKISSCISIVLLFCMSRTIIVKVFVEYFSNHPEIGIFVGVINADSLRHGIDTKI